MAWARNRKSILLITTLRTFNDRSGVPCINPPILPALR